MPSHAPVYVASRGRPYGRTFSVLRESGVAFSTLVEPHEADAYVEAGHQNVMILGGDDQGLAYSRQWALDDARSNGHELYWMLDDDISGFYVTDTARKRCEKATAWDVLRRAEEWLRGTDRALIGIVALEYQQFAWNAQWRPTWNSYTDVAALISPRVMANYRRELPLKVDRDFTLQVLASGMDTARLRWLSFSVPTNGSNDGGLHDRYAEGIEETSSEMMQRLWPGICEAKRKPNGRPDVKINWRHFRRQ